MRSTLLAELEPVIIVLGLLFAAWLTKRVLVPTVDKLDDDDDGNIDMFE